MPRRAKPTLSPEREQALKAELRLYVALEARATLDKHVHISRMEAAGMSLRDIAAELGVTHDTVRRWKEAGERERDRRRRGDTERSGEPEQDS